MVATKISTDTQNLVTDITRTNSISENGVWLAFFLTGVFTAFPFAKRWQRSNENTDTIIIVLIISLALQWCRSCYPGIAATPAVGSLQNECSPLKIKTTML